MFTRLHKARLKINAIKSCFGAHKFDYLGYHVTRGWFMPLPKKVEAVQALAVPKTCKQLRQFISMIKFYRDRWQKRSDLLAPLTCLNFQKCQIRLERQAPNFFRCYQTCYRTWSIVGLSGLQCSVWNTYWCFQTTNWLSHIPKGQAHRFLFSKNEQRPTELQPTP